MRRSVHIGLSLLTVLVLLIVTAGTSSAHQDGMHILKIKAPKGGKPHGSANLFSHGGAIESAARVYIGYWGPQWASGCSTRGVTSAQAQAHVEALLNAFGRTPCAN